MDIDPHGAARLIALDRLLAAVDSDLELLVDIIENFDADTVTSLREIERAVGARHAPALELAAHRLKSSLLAIGADHTAQTARSLELAARAGDLVGAAPLAGALADEMGLLAAELRALGDDLAAGRRRESRIPARTATAG